MIEMYEFGRMVVDGVAYSSDIILFPDAVSPRHSGVQSSWWRLEGHSLHVEDLDTVIRYKPDILIVGTGHAGAMSVPPETVSALSRMGIRLLHMRTAEAVLEFNRLSRSARVVGAFHLTC